MAAATISRINVPLAPNQNTNTDLSVFRGIVLITLTISDRISPSVMLPFGAPVRQTPFPDRPVFTYGLNGNILALFNATPGRFNVEVVVLHEP